MSRSRRSPKASPCASPWSGPTRPAIPIASVKLVNDLNLIVTNLDTGDVFFGNDIIAGNDFNFPWDTNTVPNVDVVNNVENVFLSPQASARTIPSPWWAAGSM